MGGSPVVMGGIGSERRRAGVIGTGSCTSDLL